MGVYKNNSGTLNLLAGGTVFADNPIGSILPFGGSTAPAGWMLCQGQAISRTAYADLFAVIGTSYGAGNGTTTFNIPDLRGKVPVGQSSDTEFNALGKTGGEKTHKLTVTELPSHAHKTGIRTDAAYGAGPVGSTTAQVLFSQTVSDTSYIGGNGAHNNLQPYNTVNYIIKVTSIGIPSDFETAVDEKIDDITAIEYNTPSLVSQSNYTFGKCQYTKTGHLCTAYIQLAVVSPVASEINCASGFPKAAQDGANTHFWAFRWDNFNVDPVGLYINQNGNLLVKGGITGGTSPYVVSFTYITTE